jgi:cardiolipin synthase A/B
VSNPYIHAKMIIADQKRAFVGSENLSLNSLTAAREVGIIVSDPGAVGFFESKFNQDWTVAIKPPAASSVTCPMAPPLGN